MTNIIVGTIGIYIFIEKKSYIFNYNITKMVRKKKKLVRTDAIYQS